MKKRGDAPKIVVVGPGAMGCLFAVFFHEAGHAVRLLDKDPDRADAISRHGIRVEDAAGARTVPIAVSADASSFGPADLLCVCVKSYDTEAAIRHAGPAIGPHTRVISLQNGFGNLESIAATVAVERVVCAITTHGATGLRPGHIRHAGQGLTWLAPASASSQPALETVAELLTNSRINARMVANVKTLLWSKLIVSAAINPLTAIWNVKNGELLENPLRRADLLALASEAAAVARAEGVALLYDDERVEVERICRATAGNVSSMLQDVRRRHKTEIESITGVIVRKARAGNVKVPNNENLLEKIRNIERETTCNSILRS